MNNHCLAACAITRRVAAIAIFRGMRLEYTKVLQLQSVSDRAQESISGLISWAADQFAPEVLALLSVEASSGRGVTLTELAAETGRTSGLVPWTISFDELFRAFAEPPLRSRRQLRDAAQGIWPVLNGGRNDRIVLDAVAVGLYAQTERLIRRAIDSDPASDLS